MSKKRPPRDLTDLSLAHSAFCGGLAMQSPRLNRAEAAMVIAALRYVRRAMEDGILTEEDWSDMIEVEIL